MKKQALMASLLATVALAPSAWAQGCGSAPGDSDALCGGAGTGLSAQGFAISVDNGSAAGDARLTDLQRKADAALANAGLQVRFDGLEAERALDAHLVGQAPVRPGDMVTLQSRLNYAAFVSRGEFRIIDAAAPGGARTVRVLPVTPGGRASTPLPGGKDLLVVHRVYDRAGRYDETRPLPLDGGNRRGLSDGEVREEGTSTLSRRGIPITGGGVTVSGTGLPPNARVRAMGEETGTDAEGRFVIRRILPVGDHAINVAFSTTDITRDIKVPKAEWFHVGIIDITLGWRTEDSRNATGQDIGGFYNRGRIAGYVRGRTASGVRVTASVDSREEDLRDIFRNLDRRDPQSLLRRLDPDDLYPTYGDDSTIEETAPTSGRFYARVEKDNNHVLWGNYRAALHGAEFIRNERTLYGLQGHWESPAVTSEGDPRSSVDAYAAQPDNLPGRDVFRGTGGSVYFLSQQDISFGSETVTVEIRDPQSGRIIDRRTLTNGADYDIKYIQGIIRLRRPLSAHAPGGGLISDNPNGDNNVNLVAQYEWTPDALDTDGYAYGARGQAWVNDNLRLGVSGMVERTGAADQTVTGADLRWQHSERTWAEAEYATSDGPGFGAFTSTDGGLTGNTSAATGGRGRAFRLSAQVDPGEMGVAASSLIGGYYEEREAGFTSLDHSVTSDETLRGLYTEFAPDARTELRFRADLYENDAGREDNEAGLELHRTIRDGALISLAAEHLERTTPGDPANTGARTDLALRYTLTPSDDLSWYVFGQGTAERSGGLLRNNRAGVGADVVLSDHWRFSGEVSDGNQGVGARALFSHDTGEGDSSYFGYTLDPDRVLTNTVLNGRDRGQFVAGGTRRLSARASAYAENTYDLFGRRRSLTGTYGVDYAHSEHRSTSVAFEAGTISDPTDGSFRRHAVSVAHSYDTKMTDARVRLEYRRERGTTGATGRDSDTVVVSGDLTHRFSESSRFVGGADFVHTDAQSGILADAEYAELSLGYAYRPVVDDRLNVLARYRYVHDEYGQIITSGGGSQIRGPLQHSHIFSVDAEYDLTPRWSVGGKLGYRLAETAPAGSSAFTENDAWLVVANARLHVTHNWDALAEVRALGAEQADTTDYGLLVVGYRHLNEVVKLGVGYNFGSFSDDLADLTHDDQGLFVNLVAKF